MNNAGEVKASDYDHAMKLRADPVDTAAAACEAVEASAADSKVDADRDMAAVAAGMGTEKDTIAVGNADRAS